MPCHKMTNTRGANAGRMDMIDILLFDVEQEPHDSISPDPDLDRRPENAG